MTTCHCGMTIPRASGMTGCAECGTTCCRTCALEIGAVTYCRWCATSLAPAGSR